MKRYLLFGYDVHYPKGGLNDLIDSFDKESDINDFFVSKQTVDYREIFGDYYILDHYEIFDTESGNHWNYYVS